MFFLYGPHLLRSMPAAIVRPARWPEYIHETGAHIGRHFYILENILPFMGENGKGVVGIEVTRQTVIDLRVILILGLKSAEELVPENKDHSHVLVQVAGVARM